MSHVTHTGYLLHTEVAQRSVFGVREGDVFGCMADVGWLVRVYVCVRM